MTHIWYKFSDMCSSIYGCNFSSEELQYRSNALFIWWHLLSNKFLMKHRSPRMRIVGTYFMRILLLSIKTRLLFESFPKKNDYAVSFHWSQILRIAPYLYKAIFKYLCFFYLHICTFNNKLNAWICRIHNHYPFIWHV